MGNTSKTIVAATAAFALMLGTECNAPANISTPIKMIDTSAISPADSPFIGFDAPTTYGFAGYWANGGAGAMRYSSAPGNYTVLASTSTPIPGGSGLFTSFRSPNSSMGFATGVNQEGIYTLDDATHVVKVADRSTPIPGGTGTFVHFGMHPPGQQYGTFYADDGATQRGIYGYTNPNYSSLHVIVDTHTLFPLSSETLTSISEPALPSYPDSASYFIARSATWRGIMQVGASDVFGTILSGDSDYEEVADGGTPVVIRHTSSTFGVYWMNLYSPLNLRVVANYQTPIPGGTGNFTHFQDLNAFPGYPDSGLPVAVFVGLGSDGQKGIYAGELSQTGEVFGKVIAVGDTLDGKIVSDLDLSNQALGAYQVYFLAHFQDGSSGIFVTDVPEAGSSIALLATLLFVRRRHSVK